MAVIRSQLHNSQCAGQNDYCVSYRPGLFTTLVQNIINSDETGLEGKQISGVSDYYLFLDIDFHKRWNYIDHNLAPLGRAQYASAGAHYG